MDVVIIGAGQAAAQLAMSLRQDGFAGSICVIGDEPYLPYQRPPLSKKFLHERGSPELLLLRPASFWQDHEVRLLAGSAASKVDPKERRVSLRDGRDIAYRTLVFATGTRARPLALRGSDLPNVFSLRKIEDVVQLRPALDQARRIGIIGGGYIGLEVAAAMRMEKRDVTVLEAQTRVMARVTGEEVSAFFERLHRERGVDIRLGAKLLGIEQITNELRVRRLWRGGRDGRPHSDRDRSAGERGACGLGGACL